MPPVSSRSTLLETQTSLGLGASMSEAAEEALLMNGTSQDHFRSIVGRKYWWVWAFASAIALLFSLGLFAWYQEDLEAQETSLRNQLHVAAYAGAASVREVFDSSHMVLEIAQQFLQASQESGSFNVRQWDALEATLRAHAGRDASISWMPDADDAVVGEESWSQSPHQESGHWVWSHSLHVRIGEKRIQLSHRLGEDSVLGPLEVLRPKPDGQIYLVGNKDQIIGAMPQKDAVIGKSLVDVAPDLVSTRWGEGLHSRSALFDGREMLVEVSRAPHLSLKVIMALPTDFQESGEMGPILLIYLSGLLLIVVMAYMLWVMLIRVDLTKFSLEREVVARTRSLKAEINTGRQREEELWKLRQAVMASPSLLALVKRDGRLDFFNASFVKAVRFSETQPMPERLSDLLSKDDTMWGDVAHCLAEGMSWSGEVYLTGAEGEERWLSLNLAPVTVDGDHQGHFVVAGDDVTNLHLQALEISRMHDQAESASRAKSEFLLAMSHQLRTPLNSILGFGRLLAAGAEGTPSQHRYAQAIVDSGDKLLSQINDVLSLADFEAGRVVPSFVPVNLSLFVVGQIQQMSEMAQSRSVRIRNLLDDRTLPWVVADQDGLSRVMRTLLDNAIRFSPDGGNVLIEGVALGNGYVRVLVSDHGPGIPSDLQDSLFEPFVLAEQDSTDGMGLSLVIAKKLMTAMGGDIGFITEPEHGSVFWLEIPVDPITRVEEGGFGGQMIGGDHGKSVHVMYIDDSTYSQELVAAILDADSSAHWQLTSALTAEDGLVKLDSVQPDLIIMDVMLPGMSGIDAARMIRQIDRRRDVPILGLSANASPDTAEEGLRAGFTDFLVKPFTIRTFMDKIRDCLKKDAQDA